MTTPQITLTYTHRPLCEDYDAIISGEVAELVKDETPNKGLNNRTISYAKGSEYEDGGSDN